MLLLLYCANSYLLYVVVSIWSGNSEMLTSKRDWTSAKAFASSSPATKLIPRPVKHCKHSKHEIANTGWVTITGYLWCRNGRHGQHGASNCQKGRNCPCCQWGNRSWSRCSRARCPYHDRKDPCKPKCACWNPWNLCNEQCFCTRERINTKKQ